MIVTRMLKVAECDGCKAVVATDSRELPVKGELGTVAVKHSNGTVSDEDWYACRPSHVGRAIKAIRDRAAVNDSPKEPASPFKSDSK